jgi:hypothetical protein
LHAKSSAKTQKKFQLGKKRNWIASRTSDIQHQICLKMCEQPSGEDVKEFVATKTSSKQVDKAG